jgi:hypothetical protein
VLNIIQNEKSILGTKSYSRRADRFQRTADRQVLLQFPSQKALTRLTEQLGTGKHANTPAREINRASIKPPWLIPRGLTRKEAAAYFRLSPSAFGNAVRDGFLPGPTLPGKRYDRMLLDRAMNKLSGITEHIEPLSSLDDWKKRRGTNEP